MKPFVQITAASKNELVKEIKKAKQQLVATKSPQKSVKETPKAKKQLVATRSSPQKSVNETPKAKKQLVGHLPCNYFEEIVKDKIAVISFYLLYCSFVKC